MSRAERRWTCIEILRDYCEAVIGRFVRDPQETAKPITDPDSPSNYYRLARPGILWNGDHGGPLPKDGGKKRRLKPKKRPDGRRVGEVRQKGPSKGRRTIQSVQPSSTVAGVSKLKTRMVMEVVVPVSETNSNAIL